MKNEIKLVIKYNSALNENRIYIYVNGWPKFTFNADTEMQKAYNKAKSLFNPEIELINP